MNNADWKIRAATEIDKLLRDAVIKNTGIKTGFFSGISIQDIANIININYKDNINNQLTSKTNFLFDCLDFLAHIEKKVEGNIRVYLSYQNNNCLEITIHEKKLNITYHKSLNIGELFNSSTNILSDLTDHIINEANYLIKRKYFGEK